MSKTENKSTEGNKEVLRLPLLPSSTEEISLEETAKLEDSFQAPADQLRRKEFDIKRSGDGLWAITIEGGGQLPAGLHGHFTSIEEADIAILKYKRG